MATPARPIEAPKAEPPVTEPGWKHARVAPSLAEVYRSVPVSHPTVWRKLLAFAGPGYLVAVGYMDPGNWATDLAGGSAFGYTLLCVILLSNLMAILLQGLAAKLGIVTGRDLAQACRDHYRPERQLRALDPLRDRDRGLRPGRGHRRGDRAEPAVRHPARLGSGHHGAGRDARAVPPEQGIPAARGAGDRPGRDRGRVLPVRDICSPSRTSAESCAGSCRPRRFSGTRRCCTSRSASSAPR